MMHIGATVTASSTNHEPSMGTGGWKMSPPIRLAITRINTTCGTECPSSRRYGCMNQPTVITTMLWPKAMHCAFEMLDAMRGQDSV